MLNLSKGIVPQLVDQYNDIIEHNLLQTLQLVEFRENRNNSLADGHLSIKKSVHWAADLCRADSEPDSPLDISVIRELTPRLHQKDERVSAKSSQTVNPLTSDNKKKSLVAKYDRNDKDKDNKDPEAIRANKELIPIKLNPALEHLTRRRKHNFLTKTIVAKEICGICGQSIDFSEKYVQCVDCIAVSHVACANELPIPCIRYTNPNLRPTKSLSDYVYPAFRPSIPALLIHCIREVEQRCQESSPDMLYVMDSEGLKQVKDLYTTLTKAKNGYHLLKKYNINIICGVIKKFLSAFIEPLIDKNFWKQFSYNMKKKSDEELESQLKQSITDSNVTNRETLSLLVLHLKHLANNQKSICLENFVQVFCPIICGDTEVMRKLKLMEVLFEIRSDFWINTLTK